MIVTSTISSSSVAASSQERLPSLSKEDMNGQTSTNSREAAALIQEREAQIATLQKQVSSLNNQLAAALDLATRTSQKRRHHPLSPHATTVQEVMKGKRPLLMAERARMGRTASISTKTVLDSIPDDTQHPLAQRILEMFQHPASHMDYLNSELFAKDIFKLASKVRHLLEREPRVVFVQSPAYVFGDIHGNLEDLHFFSDNIWRLGMSLTAGNFCFLGDYVDRGMSCLECIAYLLAMKLQLPNKVYLLRGNHETRDVNGWEEHYAERSFIYQCRSRFGDEIGYRVWEACNQVFDRMPLAGVIDQDIFCVHGGIPRPISADSTRIQDILNVPKVAGINPPYEHEDDLYQQVASDCIWSDPASSEQENNSVDQDTGYGESLRGGGAICFGHKAVTNFLQEHGFSYIMRAHEAHAEGVAVSKGARVFTVFSTSKDHNQGSQAMAGCILVDNDKLQVINRSPAYRNQYVHRRDSVSLATLPDAEIQKRMKLGLVTSSPRSDEEQEEEETWEDIEDDNNLNGGEDLELSEPEEFRFAKNRRSSVDLSHMTGNIHDQETHTEWEVEPTAAATLNQLEPENKRQRSKQLGVVSSAIEERSDEELETVNGDEEEEDAVLNDESQ